MCVSRGRVSVAQWKARPSPKGKVAGSSPARDVYIYTFDVARSECLYT